MKDAEAHAPVLSAEPADALIDVPRRIVLQGLAPGEVVTLTSRTRRGPGVDWQAAARFVADAQGCVDLSRDAPLPGGAYEGVSPMGLVWAQAPAGPGASREVFAAEPAAPLHTTLAASRADGTPLATAGFVQRLAADGVTREDVSDAAMSAVLYRPAGDGPHPVVVVLNGSGGGRNEPRAALYASHGFAALALGYFKCPGRPDYISNTPLEYFEQALQWAHRVLKPAHGFVALSGQSRGGELVLLLGAMFPSLVSAVVGYVPGALVHGAQNACDPASGRDGPAWLYRGEALPHLWQHNRTASWASWDDGPPPRRHAAALLTALQDADAVERARIRVERIAGPVMLLSATDDGSWPSSLYGRMVAGRLAAHGHRWPVEHLDYEGAGHSIVFPFVPTTQLVYAHPVSGRVATGGGTPAANAHADADSWPAVLRFLRAAVAARAEHPPETPA